jgi:adenylate cyclase, class 2
MLARSLLRNSPLGISHPSCIRGSLAFRNGGSTLYSAVSSRVPTNREIEVKLPIADIPALLRDLKRLGASNRGRALEQNTLYDTPQSDFRRRRWLLRLRTETPARSRFAPAAPRRSLLTFKSPPPPARKLAASARSHANARRYKDKLERETALAQPARWPAMLRSLGLRSTFRYEKYRTEFRLGALHVSLDETPVGVFLELEGAMQVIDKVASALNFSPSDYIRATYWDLYAADCRRRGRTPRNMLFHA